MRATFAYLPPRITTGGWPLDKSHVALQVAQNVEAALTGGGSRDFHRYGGDGGDLKPPEPPDRDPPDPPEPGWKHKIELRGMAHAHRRPSRTLLAPALVLLDRLGGSITFDRMHLRPYGAYSELTNLGAAVVSYAALLTWLFDDPRLYRYGRLRNLGRDLASKIGVEPLRNRLERTYDGDELVPVVTLSELDLGSVEFLQRVALVSGIAAGLISAAADGPTAWRHTEEVYLPAAYKLLDLAAEASQDAVEVTSEFLTEYFKNLGEVLEVATVPVGPTPSTPVRSGPHPIDTSRRRRIRGS